MSINLSLDGTPGDTLASLSSYTASVANELASEVNVFLDDLLTQRQIDFSNVGDLTTLNYLQWDYNVELQQLIDLRPTGQFIDTPGSEAAIEEVEQLAGVTPTQPVLTVPVATMPTLDAERPVINLPALPGTDVGEAPADAPAVTDHAAPDAPLVTLPATPTFEQLQLPVAPSFTIPTLSLQAPANLIAPPTTQFSYVDAGYTSALRDPLTAKLLFDLENGGYGIEPQDEALLFTRARDRAEQAGALALDEAKRRAYDMSFPLPTGALLSDMERAREAMRQELSKANMEITLKRSDLYVENRKFTITQVQELEKISVALYNAIQERALNAAKAAVELGVAVFDATVRNFAAQLDAYKTEAQVFETRVRAELAKAELYKSQIEAERLRGEFNQQRVELYQAQLNGITAVVNLYKTRVDAVEALTRVQGQKIEVFKSRVEAYATKVRAKATEYEMYRSAVAGETAKLDIYRTDIAAFETRTRAEESRIRALTMGNDTLVKQYENALGQYKAQLDALTKAAEQRMELNRVVLGLAGVNVANYRALSDAVLAGVQTRVSSQKMNNEWNIATLNSHVESTKMRLEQLKLTIGSRVEIDKFGSKFLMDPLTATLASLNGLSVKTAE